MKPAHQVRFLGLFIILGMASWLAACQAAPSGPEIVIEDAWGRSSPRVATTAAFYLVIKNNGGETDRLVAGESPSCGVVEMHESYALGDGVMGMRPAPGNAIEIPAHGQTELKMGGYHLMCIDKLAGFEEGQVLSLILTFAKSGQKVLEVDIRQEEP